MEMTKEQEVMHALGRHTWLTLSSVEINEHLGGFFYTYAHRRCVGCGEMECLYEGTKWKPDDSAYREELNNIFNDYEKNS